MIYLLILFTISYLFIISIWIIGFDRVSRIFISNSSLKHTFTILIPFRNEASNLPSLLSSLSQLNYPADQFDIMLINDGSTDLSTTLIKQFIKQYPTMNIRLIDTIRKTNSPKKDAINTGITEASNEWIITTDADCKVPVNWLQLFNQIIEKEHPVFIAAPVKYFEQKSVLFHFQNLNLISLIGSTIGSFGIKKPIMCNGANLCYRADAFKKVNGFEGNSDLASGDDIFLLEKMYNTYPDKVSYLKSPESIVETSIEKSWGLLLHQQLRWASKSTSYKNKFTQLVGLVVFSMNSLLLMLLITVFFNEKFRIPFLIIFGLKLLFDFILILKTSIFLKNYSSLKYYFIMSILYPFFIVFIGLQAPFKNYEWKGRNFQK